MINFIPSVILAAAGLGVLLLTYVRKGFGISWLVSAVVALLVWVFILVIHWLPPSSLYLIGWNPLEISANILAFQMDWIAWPFAFGLASLALGVVLTTSVRLNRGGPLLWVAVLLITGAGLVAVQASSPMALILAWSLIDLVELILILGRAFDYQAIQRVVFSFSSRIAGTFLLLLAMLVSRSNGMALSLSNIDPQIMGILLVVVMLRLGVMPRRYTFTGIIQSRRELGVLMRIVAPASALVFLARLPFTTVHFASEPLLFTLINLAALYASAMWLASDDEIGGLGYWIIAVSGLALISAMNGESAAVIVWSLALILVGSVVFLYTNRDPRPQYIPLSAIIAFTGFPFSPIAGGWSGLLSSPSIIWIIFAFLIHLLLLLGLLKHTFRPGEPYKGLEEWIQAVYPAGLLIMVIGLWVIGAWGWSGSYTFGIWWASLIPIGIVLSGYYFQNRWINSSERREMVSNWSQAMNESIGQPLTSFFGFAWVYRFLQFIYRLVGQLIDFVTNVLEGEGGILWVLLLLALLGSLVSAGGSF
jgi:hypothetical protein